MVDNNWKLNVVSSKNWWNITFNYKMNKNKDYAYIDFYNPDKQDWNILYSAWYAT